MMEATCIPAAEHRTQSLLQQIQKLGDGYIQISSPEIEWFAYGREGQIQYLTNSIEPFERLSRILRKCLQGTAINAQGLALQARAQYEQASEVMANGSSASPLLQELDAYHQVLLWLKASGQLNHDQLSQITHQSSLEVLESFWLLPEEDLNLQAIGLTEAQNTPSSESGPTALPSLDFVALCTEVNTRLQRWETFQPELYSPYQRPYLSGTPLHQSNLSPEFQARLRQILIGFSLRQVAMLLNQDDLSLAEQFLPLVRQGVIKLHEPFAPFDRLPWKQRPHNPKVSSLGNSIPVAYNTKATQLTQIAQMSSELPSRDAASAGVSLGTNLGANLGSGASAPSEITATKTWKIVCIDDSPAVLNEINRFLQADLFSVTLIDDSKKALMKINSIRPDVILLDANMPGVDGYQVCTMLRKSSALKHIPVIMVTGNRGLVNRARAKMVGITDYLNKPFSQKELLEIVFRHLSE
ncbi:MAG: response regulator [Synechococcales cyanobacterium RU_4_20]|nr:response regulator [Synechococcales cyanobacterium RU_4_20]NJR70682.1 response regulator [Synechococcales cyanobacterium CRU_2_2]